MKLDLPASVRDLEAELTACGFTRSESGNSHGKWTHPCGAKAVLARGHKDADRSAARDARRAIAITEAIAQGKIDRAPSINARSFKYDAIPNEEELYDQALVRAGRVRPRLEDPIAAPPITADKRTEQPIVVDKTASTYLTAPADLFPVHPYVDRSSYPVILAVLNSLPQALWAPTVAESRDLAEIQWPPDTKDVRTFELAGSGFIREGRESIGRYADGAWIRSCDRSPVTGAYFKAWCRIGSNGGPAGLIWLIEPLKADPANRTSLTTNDRAQVVAEIERLDKMVTRAKGDAREAQIDKAVRREAITAPVAPPGAPPIEKTPAAPTAAPTAALARGFTIRGADRAVMVAYRRNPTGRNSHVELRPTFAGAHASYAKTTRGVVEEILALLATPATSITADQCGVDITHGTLGMTPVVRISAWTPRARFRTMPPKSAYYRVLDLAQALAAFVDAPATFWHAPAPRAGAHPDLPVFTLQGDAWPPAIRADSVPFVPTPIEPTTPAPVVEPTTPIPAPTAPVVAPAPIAQPTPATTPPAHLNEETLVALEALRVELDSPEVRFLLGRAVTLDDVLARVIRAGIEATRRSFGG